MPRYSIIIPAYNEGARLEATLERVLSCVSLRNWDAEVIVVNDGSRDNTADLVRAQALEHPNLRLLENPGNRGKGYSVRNGMLNASGEVLRPVRRRFSATTVPESSTTQAKSFEPPTSMPSVSTRSGPRRRLR